MSEENSTNPENIEEIDDESPIGNMMMQAFMKNPEALQNLPDLITKAKAKIEALEAMSRDQNMLKRGIDLLYQLQKEMLVEIKANRESIDQILDLIINECDEGGDDEPPMEGQEG